MAGESMELFLRTGDALYAALPGPGAAGAARVGDMVLSMGRDAPVLAHRVICRFGRDSRKRLVTKGDFHLLPDGFISPSAVLGRVRVVERAGLRVWLDCRLVRALNAAIALYSLGGALLYRLAQLLLWVLGLLSLRFWALAEVLCGEPLSMARPGLWRRWIGLEQWLETAHLTLLRAALRRGPAAVFAALARHTGLRHAGDIQRTLAEARPASREGALSWAAGELAQDAEWSGEVRVFGDVVVLPGATLTVRPGTRVIFLPGNRLHHGIRRRREGQTRALTDSKSWGSPKPPLCSKGSKTVGAGYCCWETFRAATRSAMPC